MEEKILVPEFERPVVELEIKINRLKEIVNKEKKQELIDEIKVLQEKCEKLKNEIYKSLTPFQKIQLARHPKRPYTMDYINLLFTDFIELHGDRLFSDDKAIICGIGMFEDIPVVVMGQQKGRTLEESIDRNFGMMHPEGYRKALRIMKLGEKFKKPIIIFIDTPGAYPGIGAEERGQAEAIAKNLREMSILKTQIICIVIGEGSSGGALGIGIADRIIMLENSYYSVISPEGCAAILFKDSKKSHIAANALKLTAQDLLQLGIADEIIPEPLGGVHRDIDQTVKKIKLSFKKNLEELKKIPVKKLIENRYNKYRKIMNFSS